jgi:hypothetical protein
MAVTDIAPPNSLLLIMDRSIGQPPESMAGEIAASTSTCVAIGTRSEHDGTTHVTLDDGHRTFAVGTPCFDGVLETPSRRLAVCSVIEEVFLEADVMTERTRVRVSVNDPTEPREVYIIISAFEG